MTVNFRGKVVAAALVLAVVLAARFFGVLAYIVFGLVPCKYLGSLWLSGVYNVAVVCYFAAG